MNRFEIPLGHGQKLGWRCACGLMHTPVTASVPGRDEQGGSDRACLAADTPCRGAPHPRGFRRATPALRSGNEVGPDFLLNGWPDTGDARVANDRVAVKKELHCLIVKVLVPRLLILTSLTLLRELRVHRRHAGAAEAPRRHRQQEDDLGDELVHLRREARPLRLDKLLAEHRREPAAALARHVRWEGHVGQQLAEPLQRVRLSLQALAVGFRLPRLFARWR